MTIKLLMQNEYDTLLSIQKNNPKLTFQNKGYQYIDRSTLSEDDKAADSKVKEILNNHIEGFVSFDNFLTDKKGELNIRFQYKWDWRFTGVGYITVRELLNGFDENKK
jgi:hypothetical protein